jgi:hypothetical protein
MSQLCIKPTISISNLSYYDNIITTYHTPHTIYRVYLHYHRIDWAAEHFEKALLASEADLEGAGAGVGV